MIAQIKGTVIDTDEKSIIVENNGIGYQIFMSHLDMPNINDDVSLYTVFIVREDAQELYGFTTTVSRDLFKLLITISGIGPRGALGILSLANSQDLLSYIARGDATYLTKVSGIGKKTAEKIILELKDKIEKMVQVNETSSVTNDALDALTALGYSPADIRSALARLPIGTDTENTQDVIRAVLKLVRKI